MPTYYVIGAGGSDANDGSNDTTQGWATIDHAMNTAQTAGDIVYVKATGTYSETPNIDVGGGTNDPILYIGYTTTPGDNGKVTVSGTTNCLTSAITASVNYVFANFIFSGASSHGVSMVSADNISWFNCEFNNNGGHGITIDNDCSFVNCVAHSNATIGIDGDTLITIVGSKVYGNGSAQCFVSTSELFYKNLVYGMSGVNDHAYDCNTCTAFIGNTIDGENAAVVNGFDAGSENSPIILDNIFYDLQIGAKANAFGGGGFATTLVAYNLMNSNVTDYSGNNFGGVFVGYQDVTGAPAFTSEATDDYTLGEASPAVGAGLTPGGIT